MTLQELPAILGWLAAPDRGIIAKGVNDMVMLSNDSQNLLRSRLVQARRDRGLGVRPLARRVGTSAARLSRIENGRSQPDTQLLQALSESLDIPWSEALDLVAQSPLSRNAPPLSKYLRAKYGFSPDEVARVQALVERLLHERFHQGRL